MSSARRRIVIITSCTGSKYYASDNPLTMEDFRLLHTPEFHCRERLLHDSMISAEAMYSGQQHTRLMRGVEVLRNTSKYDVDLYIVSAGYGLIPADREIAPYECTFQSMKAHEIIAWSNHLRIPAVAREVLSQPADHIFVILGEKYLRSLQLDDSVSFGGRTLFFASANSIKKIPRKPDVVEIIPFSNVEAKRFRCGLVGLKGEITARILRRLASSDEAFFQTLIDADPTTLLEHLDEPVEPKPQKAKIISRLNVVDKVIHLSKSWHKQSEQKALRFFMPDWDDMVDPDYDFETDTHKGGVGAWSNQVYAHQMHLDVTGDHTPSYDGLLVSRAVAESSQNKTQQIRERGIHKHLRVPREFPVLGDCGAFSYLLQSSPPYSTDEILDYYTDLDFDFGVSIDHLMFGAADDVGKQARYELTISNAEEFINEHKRRGLPWTPIGALQGLTPAQYAEAAKQYVNMGYTYLAIGGQVRSKTPEILTIASAIREVIPAEVKLHLFGVARLDALNDFIRLKINSVDTSSYLRRAWISMGKNYIGRRGLYAAIRIPQARSRIPKNASVEEGQKLYKLEMEALKALRALDRGECSEDACLRAILNYKIQAKVKFPDRIVGEYRATLMDKPWKECQCAVCQSVGIEVVIFRGNNRNRRRGFHNNHMFYTLMNQAIQEGKSTYNWESMTITDQQKLPLSYT